jgi:hypothetical protein
MILDMTEYLEERIENWWDYRGVRGKYKYVIAYDPKTNTPHLMLKSYGRLTLWPMNISALCGLTKPNNRWELLWDAPVYQYSPDFSCGTCYGALVIEKLGQQ